ncbi:MAG: hypothetical protein WA004_02810 [Saprospiraceae bacterium]
MTKPSHPLIYLLAGWLASFSFTACGQEQPGKTKAEQKTGNPEYYRSILDFNKKDSSWYMIEHLPTRKVGIEHAERGIIIPLDYDIAWELGGNRWFVMGRGIQKAIFDTLGNQLTPFENNYEVIASLKYNPDLAVVHQNRQVFLLNPADQQPVTGERYARIVELGNGFLGFVQAETALYALGAPDGKRLTEFVYQVIERSQESHEKTAKKLGTLQAGHRVAAFAWLEQGFICLDDEGREVECIER